MVHNTSVIVLGMHRSGTSALAGALGLIGVDLSGALLGPAADNVRGFWEHADIVMLHEHLLASLGSSWDDVRPLPDAWWTTDRVKPFRAGLMELVQRDFTEARIWGVKDPRICKLLPLWRDVLSELDCKSRFVLIHRHPSEVAHSLQERNGFATAKSGQLWLQHNLLAEKWTRDQPRLFISYQQLLHEPRETLHRIANLVAHGLGERVDANTPQITGFLMPQLRHHAEPAMSSYEAFEAYAPLVADLCAALADACREDTSTVRERFCQLGERCGRMTDSFDAALASHVGDLQRDLTELRKRLDRTQSPAAWRLLQSLRRRSRRVR